MVSLGYAQRAIITPLTHLPRDLYAQEDTYPALRQFAVGCTGITKCKLKACCKGRTYHEESSFTHMICTSPTHRKQEGSVYICKGVVKQSKSTLADDTCRSIGIDDLLWYRE